MSTFDSILRLIRAVLCCLKPITDLLAGRAEGTKFLGGERVDEMRANACHVVWSSRHEGRPALIGECGEGSASILGTDETCDESCPLHAIDLMREATA